VRQDFFNVQFYTQCSHGFVQCCKIKFVQLKCCVNRSMIFCYKSANSAERKGKQVVYTWWPKKLAHFVLYALTSSNIDRFSKLFHCQNEENIRNNAVTKDLTTPQVCTVPCEIWVSSKQQLKTGRLVTTHFKSASSSSRTDTRWTFDVKTAGCDSYFG